jgi:hypothetical protein
MFSINKKTAKEFTPMRENVCNMASVKNSSWHVAFGSTYVLVTEVTKRSGI